MTIDINPLLQQIEEIDILSKTDWNGDEDLYNKLILVKPLCESRLKNIYANLLSQSEISQLQGQLNNLSSYVTTYKAGNTSYSTHIINTINAIIPIISKIPFVGKGETSAVFSKIIDDFSQRNAEVVSKITKEKEDLVSEVETLRKTINSLSSDIVKKNTEVVSLTTEFQKQFSDAQEKRSTDFADAQKERESEFTDAQNERDEEFTNKEIERKNLFEEQKTSFEKEAETTLKEMEKIKIKIEEIYGIVGKSSIIGTQKIYANNAKRMAHWLQGASLILMLSAIGVLFCMFQGQLETITWSKFIYRFSIGGILLLPAFFLANEAKKQRDKEAKYRELEIKMAAITPYFLEISDGASKDNENLPEKDRIKLELAQKLLSPSEHISDKNAILPPEIVDIIKSAMEIAKKKQ